MAGPCGYMRKWLVPQLVHADSDLRIKLERSCTCLDINLAYNLLIEHRLSENWNSVPTKRIFDESIGKPVLLKHVENFEDYRTCAN
jgi:hypothetical protein